jgi:hypothetical protein
MAMIFSLVTVLDDGLPVGCVECRGKLYRLADLAAPHEVATLFEDWPH